MDMFEMAHVIIWTQFIDFMLKKKKKPFVDKDERTSFPRIHNLCFFQLQFN